MANGPSIVLIHWKIRKGWEQKFETVWKKELTIKNRSGLIGEFLSKVRRRSATYPYITWPITCDNLAHEEQCTHYINVGLWASHKQFFDETGPHMKDDKPARNFEIERRRRVSISAMEWRIGAFPLPTHDSRGTK